jgi:hypothetical protein
VEPEPEKDAPEEALEELCKRAYAEQDMEKFLELASRIQRLIDARESLKKTPPK